MSKFLIEDKSYTLSDIYQCIQLGHTISLSDSVKEKIISSRNILAESINSGNIIYGVNTGFGKLSTIKIEDSKLNTLQNNLLMSHAAGVGPSTPNNIVKLMMFLKILSLSQGYSGVRLELVEKMLKFINIGCIPIVPSQGSVGASGDLAPLSHMSLPLIGLGELIYNSKKYPTSELLDTLKIKTIQLQYKEG